MASSSSSSSSSPSRRVGESAGWVEPLTHCPHIPPSTPSLLPPIDSPCSRCCDLSENWVCFTCRDVLCGRYINKHMLEHFQAQEDHPLAMSFRDLSAWCFKCDAYVDAQVIPALRPVFEDLYRMKFGEEAPVRMCVEMEAASSS